MAYRGHPISLAKGKMQKKDKETHDFRIFQK